MKKTALMVGFLAALGFNNAQAADLTWSGDVRYRFQSDLQYGDGASANFNSRDRQRGRIRLGASAWINDELSAGVQVATDGSTGATTYETTSRNVTFGQMFLPQAAFFNEGYLDYHPQAYGLDGQFNIVLGKRGVASDLIYVNDLVFDSDLTFDGITLQYGKDGAGKEKDGLAAVVGYYPLNEKSSRTAVGGQDAYLFVGQAGYKGEVSDIRYQLGAGYYNYVNFDVNSTSFSTVLSPSFDYTAKDFNIVELFGTLGGQVTEKLPWKLSAQYAVNTASSGGAQGRYYNLDDSQKKAWLAEVKLGDAKSVGDWSLNGEYCRIERDALTVLTDSDRNSLGASGVVGATTGFTNLKGIKVGGGYHLVQNLMLNVNYFSFKSINVDNITNRILMADVVVKF
ncbi:MAG: putative porin [Chlorobiaceae bacterium]